MVDAGNCAFTSADLAGSDAAVKKMADVFQKKADNVTKNPEMTSLIKGMNTNAMVWGGLAVPAETMSKATSQNPMLGAFSTVQSFLLSVDYKSETLLLEIKAMSPDPAKNKEMADEPGVAGASNGIVAALPGWDGPMDLQKKELVN